MLEASCPNCGVRLFQLHSETFCPSCGKSASVLEFGVHLQDSTATAYQEIVHARKSLDMLLKDSIKAGKFHATTQTAESVKASEVTLITVGTPVDEKNIPDYTDLKSASRDVGKGLKKGTLVVLKSTVSPGTTETIVKPILEDKSRLKAGRDFGLAFMPETIKEGHALHEFRTLPRIVAGVTRRDGVAASNVFSVFPASVYVYDKPSIVEAAKLFMNIYRDVNIALANELALASEKLGINVMECINAANIDPKTHLLTPGLVGGYCLTKDTYQFAQPSKEAGYSPCLITSARQLNDKMPSHVLELTDDAFEEMHLPLKNAHVAILGLSFKANSGDLRNTPARPIIEGLDRRGAVLTAHDPFVEFQEAGKLLPKNAFSRSVEESVKRASCAVIVTDHLEYRGLTAHYLKKFMASPCAIVDARHIIDPEEAAEAKVVFRGFGKPMRPMKTSIVSKKAPTAK